MAGMIDPERGPFRPTLTKQRAARRPHFGDRKRFRSRGRSATGDRARDQRSRGARHVPVGHRGPRPMPVDGAPQCRCSSPQSASGATVVIAHGPASPRIGLGNTSGRARARSPTLLARAPLRVLRWPLQNTTTAWQETPQLNGRAIRLTRGGGAQRSPRRATTATPKSGRNVRVTVSGVPMLHAGNSATTIGINHFVGIGPRPSAAVAHACSAPRWRTCSSRTVTLTAYATGSGLS